jgi:hypothetical protein
MRSMRRLWILNMSIDTMLKCKLGRLQLWDWEGMLCMSIMKQTMYTSKNLSSVVAIVMDAIMVIMVGRHQYTVYVGAALVTKSS